MQKHEGRTVVGTSLAVRKIGGGLDDPLAIDPEIIHVGDTRVLCVPVVCVDVAHRAENRAEPSEGGVNRVHIFDATAAFFVDPPLVAEAALRHAEKVTLAERAVRKASKVKDVTPVAEGQQQLEVDEDALEAAHLDGLHKKLVQGCPACEFEMDVEEREAREGAED